MAASKPKTVALQYGIAEGKWHGKRFRKALELAGLRVIDDPHAADILVAHSAGCIFLPLNSTEQLVVLINPPYWPGKSAKIRAKQKIADDIGQLLHGRHKLFLLQKFGWNILYFFGRLEHTRHILYLGPLHNIDAAIVDKHPVLIRTAEDTWCTPDLAHIQALNPRLQIHTLPGAHDDLWEHPERYVDLIQSII